MSAASENARYNRNRSEFVNLSVVRKMQLTTPQIEQLLGYSGLDYFAKDAITKGVDHKPPFLLAC